MKIETREFIHDEGYKLITDIINQIKDDSLVTPDQKSWLKRAINWTNYVEKHYV